MLPTFKLKPGIDEKIHVQKVRQMRWFFEGDFPNFDKRLQRCDEPQLLLLQRF